MAQRVTDACLEHDYLFNFLGSHRPNIESIMSLAEGAGVEITEERAKRIADKIILRLDKLLTRSKDHLNGAGYSLGSTLADRIRP